MVRFAAMTVVAFLACSPNPCSDSVGTTAVALDIAGASNTACTLTVTDGSTTLTYDIPTPSPSVPDTSLDARTPPSDCEAFHDGGVFFDGGTRTSKELCFYGDAALDQLAHARNVALCPLTLTLTCAGTVLYDHASWNFCYEQC